MTRVRRPTSGFMSEAALGIEQELTTQHRQKGSRWTAIPSARYGIMLPSDGATATFGALLVGARARGNP